MTRDKLYTDLEKLEVEPGDVVVVFAKKDIVPEEAKILVDALQSLSRDIGVLFLVMADGECVKRLPEDVMNTYGWYRQCT